MEKNNLRPFNPKGPVEDPEIAKKMAESEDFLRTSRDKGWNNHTQEGIDRLTEKDGYRERKKLIFDDIATKISNTLSKEEMLVIKDMARRYDDEDMKSFINKIAEK